jgi:uncharacterized protein
MKNGHFCARANPLALLWSTWQFSIGKGLKCSLFFFVCIACAHCFSEEPWGVDAALALHKRTSRVKDGINPGFYIIRFHQQFSTNIDCPRSHFIPSSSEYMRRAMSRYGASLGFLLGCDRLLRENSEEWLYRQISTKVGRVKYDPVP